MTAESWGKEKERNWNYGIRFISLPICPMNYTSSSSFWTAFLRFPSRQFFLNGSAFQSDNAEQIKKIQRHRWRGHSWGLKNKMEWASWMLQHSVHAVFSSHHDLNEWKICSVKREERFFDEFPAQQRQSPSMDSRASIFSLLWFMWSVVCRESGREISTNIHHSA